MLFPRVGNVKAGFFVDSFAALGSFLALTPWADVISGNPDIEIPRGNDKNSAVVRIVMIYGKPIAGSVLRHSEAVRDRSLSKTSLRVMTSWNFVTLGVLRVTVGRPGQPADLARPQHMGTPYA
ncbi:hypothetical protein G7K_6295-t1 [Saitoella complicata NRRL Y-17804]|uniref:Uncharacterized protein n=1 Tax=Saitoella complicata (strain BCRC 22490 / CBS 7301 / JCM 7358 / NBRC 10748 / NRRL Y-17804) TaxID=698492 RepID=A0A0E9NQQ5_SAICN|nr:hypothetical protein G7K_6295-t1 [Saitoella complicata NRRL Y-17804]